jgi:outer membrane protein OmpA-like peptidoglycan-associated protein
MARPLLGDVELQQVQKIETEEDQVFTQHSIPALEGDFFQGLGRRATWVKLTGVLTGAEVQEGLKTLGDKFRAAEPVDFVADITTATKVNQVIIEEMGVRELAGKPSRFEYALTLREYVAAPTPQQERPQPVPPRPRPVEIGALIVEVVVEGEPSFDYSTVTVTVEGTQEDGTSVSRTLTNRSENIWTEDPFPLGQYTARAVVTDPPPMNGSVNAVVRGGQTTQVTISLRRDRPTQIANTFVVHFWFDKAFVEPCLKEVLAQVSDYAKAHPDEKLVIVGHTDLVGSDTYNQSLSERRARSVYACLTYGRDRNAAIAEWNILRQQALGEALSAKDSWGTREYQYMLQDLDYYQGNVDGNHGPITDAGVRAFQQDKGLPSTGVVNDATWIALIDAYLGQNALNIPESQFLPNCQGEILKWLGCGEKDPVKNTQDAWRPNRRTELLFVKADRLPCPVPEPVTFKLPAQGAANGNWCLGPGDPNNRCCFITRKTEQQEKWLIQPAEPQTIIVRGSIKQEDGTPLANAQYVLLAPDGEYMDGERASGPSRGRPIPGRTTVDGRFAYPDKPKGVGIYILELNGPYVARLSEDPPGSGKGNVICKRLDGTSDFDVIVSPAETGDPRRKLRGTLFDRFGELRTQTEVEVVFSDGSRAITTTDDKGKFVVEMDNPQAVGKIRYNITNNNLTDVVFFEDFFIDLQSIHTDEGVRRRLHNLGYLADDDLSAAITAFQAVHGFDTTGEINQATRDKLVAVHDRDESPVPEFQFSDELLKPEDMDEQGPPI